MKIFNLKNKLCTKIIIGVLSIIAIVPSVKAGRFNKGINTHGSSGGRSSERLTGRALRDSTGLPKEKGKKKAPRTVMTPSEIKSFCDRYVELAKRAGLIPDGRRGKVSKRNRTTRCRHLGSAAPLCQTDVCNDFLLKATREGNIDGVRLAIKQGAKDLAHALCISVENDNYEIIGVLCSWFDAHPDAKQDAVDIAESECEKVVYSIVKSLLFPARGIDPNSILVRPTIPTI